MNATLILRIVIIAYTAVLPFTGLPTVSNIKKNLQARKLSHCYLLVLSLTSSIHWELVVSLPLRLVLNSQNLVMTK